MDNSREHWERIYTNKLDNEVSWYEEIPATSLRLIQSVNSSKSSSIIDVGGGNSNLPLELINLGFNKISVLDISSEALKRTKVKAGENANKIDWVVSNILEFKHKQQFDIWHDRAVFHFLTKQEDVEKYLDLVSGSIIKGGHLILGTFSPRGPIKCSGLEIKQYSGSELEILFQKEFTVEQSFEEIHKTPFHTEQSFTYVVFRKK